MKKILFIACLFIYVSALNAAGIPGDATGDNRIGVDDAIYTLQVVSGSRPSPLLTPTIDVYYPMHLGDSRVYSTGLTTSTRTVADSYEIINGVATFRVDIDGVISNYSADETGFYVHRKVSPTSSWSYSPRKKVFPYNLPVGTYFSDVSPVTFTSSGTSYSTTDYTLLSFLGFETVVVPAGTFADCLKFTESDMASILVGSTKYYNAAHFIYWFAPNVGRVKMITVGADGSTKNEELVSATVGGKTYSAGTRYTTASTKPRITETENDNPFHFSPAW